MNTSFNLQLLERFLFEDDTNLIAFLDSEQRIQWANRTACQDAGVDLENLVGKYCYQAALGHESHCKGCLCP